MFGVSNIQVYVFIMQWIQYHKSEKWMVTFIDLYKYLGHAKHLKCMMFVVVFIIIFEIYVQWKSKEQFSTGVETNCLEIAIRIHFQMSVKLLRFKFIAHILETIIIIIWSAMNTQRKINWSNNSRIHKVTDNDEICMSSAVGRWPLAEKLF